MAEKEGYRNALDRLDKMFPEKEVLSKKELMQITGLSLPTINRNWKNEYNSKLHGFSKVVVARTLAK